MIVGAMSPDPLDSRLLCEMWSIEQRGGSESSPGDEVWGPAPERPGLGDGQGAAGLLQCARRGVLLVLHMMVMGTF